MSSLRYHLFDGYAVLLFSKTEDRQLRKQYPLLQYVASYWAAQTQGDPEKNSHVQRLALQLLENKHKVSVVQGAREFAESTVPLDYCDVSRLSMAASSNLITITSLLYRGARLEDTNPEICRTALHYAADYGHNAIVKLLLKRGAQIDARTLNQGTAVMLAAVSGHESVVQLLLGNGAAIELENCQQGTRLNLAAVCQKTDVVAVLLKSGADTNMKDCLWSTPMHNAVSWQDGTNMIRVLSESGADLSTRSASKRTRLEEAVASSSRKMMWLLPRGRC